MKDVQVINDNSTPDGGIFEKPDIRSSTASLNSYTRQRFIRYRILKYVIIASNYMRLRLLSVNVGGVGKAVVATLVQHKVFLLKV
jgi:hypothetical protein